MHSDYFVVGPTLALRSQPAFGPPGGARLDFTVEHPQRGVLGVALSELVGSELRVGFSWEPGGASPTERTEAVRLLARILRKLSAAPLRLVPDSVRFEAEPLARDGFHLLGDGCWLLGGEVLRAGPGRAADMGELYRDPFDVVWNFEPRPWPLLGGLLAWMSRTAGGRVLDLGCGLGGNAVLLEGLGLKVFGVDVAPEAIEQCQRWVAHPRRFRVASAQALPFADARFEAVLDVGCLHLLPGPALPMAVEEVRRVLRPGGLLFSRILRRRSAAWLDAQRYRVSAAGLEPDQIMGLLGPGFDTALEVGAEFSLVVARRRGGGGG